MMKINKTSVQISLEFSRKADAMVRDTGQEHSNNGHHPLDRKRGGKRVAPRPTYIAMSPEFGFIAHMQPLPLSEAIRMLPRRYRFVLTKPGFEPFAAEVGLAEWKIIWFQLLSYTIVAALLGFLRTLLYPSQVSSTSSDSGVSSPAVLHALSLGSSLGLLLLIPLLFFGAMGLLYWLARAFGGHGIFIQQAYTTLLFLTPCGIAVSVLGIIPFVGSFLSTFFGVVLFVYCVALQCFATPVVHQMTGGKATAAVIITVLVLIPTIIASLTLWALPFVAIHFQYPQADRNQAYARPDYLRGMMLYVGKLKKSIDHAPGRLSAL
jgi:hypothetical protein